MADESVISMLGDVAVVELGSRLAAGACGSLLAQAGATVVFVEPAGNQAREHKWRHRSVFAAGKESLVIDGNDPQDVELLSRLLERADIVLTSRECDPTINELESRSASAASVNCDFPVFGAPGDRVGPDISDPMIQGLSGVAYTTGFPDGPPVPLRLPVTEYSAAVYGASACVIALTAARQTGERQTVEVSLYDCAINSLTTFLPAHFAGSEPRRLGNGHSMAVPWNAYEAIDGWILVCSATDDQWQQICQAMQRPDYAADPRFAKLADRVANRDAVDRILAEWVGGQKRDDCTRTLSEYGVANGPVLAVGQMAEDPNLVHRGMLRRLPDPVTGKLRCLLGTPLRFATGTGRAPDRIPAPDDGRERVRRLLSRPPRRERRPADVPAGRCLPLEGIRVIEIGQYTTAPLAGRHLASFGAEVIKVEPAAGDAARAWRPVRGDLSIFFGMSNAGKTSVTLDLKSEDGRVRFSELLSTADILVENLKPGSLARLGFDPTALAAVNPRLIYCAITGFGASSVYAERPAFDTVIQAMSGMMDLNASAGRPLKAGISICDIMGGQVGLFAILAALRLRERTGRGLAIDLSMHDIAAWMTAPFWPGNADEKDEDIAVVECSDGYALVARRTDAAWPFGPDLPRSALSRAELVKSLHGRGLCCVPINSVSEAVATPMCRERGLLVEKRRADGLLWPLLNSPMRISGASARIGDPIGSPVPFDEVVFTGRHVVSR